MLLFASALGVPKHRQGHGVLGGSSDAVRLDASEVDAVREQGDPLGDRNDVVDEASGQAKEEPAPPPPPYHDLYAEDYDDDARYPYDMMDCHGEPSVLTTTSMDGATT